MGYIIKNSTAIDLYEITEAGTISALTDADVSDAANFAVNCTYRVA